MSFRFICSQDHMADKSEWIEIGLACADVCTALDRGIGGRKQGDLSQAVYGEITQLMTWVESVMHGLDISLTCALYHRTVAEIQRKATKYRERNIISRFLHTKSDREMVAGWRLDLNRILHVFNVRPDTHV